MNIIPKLWKSYLLLFFLQSFYDIIFWWNYLGMQHDKFTYTIAYYLIYLIVNVCHISIKLMLFFLYLFIILVDFMIDYLTLSHFFNLLILIPLFSLVWHYKTNRKIIGFNSLNLFSPLKSLMLDRKVNINHMMH